MKQSAVACAPQHLAVIRQMASAVGLPGKSMYRRVVRRLAALEGPIALACLNSENDRDRGSLTGIAAALEAHAGGGSLPVYVNAAPIAARIEALDDPILRDTLYRRYWQGESLEAVAEKHHLRMLTVRQNHKRAMRLLQLSEDDLEQWTSDPAAPTPAASEENIVRALEDPVAAAALTPTEQSIYVHALSAAAQEAALQIGLHVGPRSVRAVRGRPWIEQPGRLPLHDLRRIAAEQPAEYNGGFAARSWTVSSHEQDWSVRITGPIGENGAEVGIFWLGGQQGVAVVDAEGAVAGICSADSPEVDLNDVALPVEITLRAVGTLD